MVGCCGTGFRYFLFAKGAVRKLLACLLRDLRRVIAPNLVSSAGKNLLSEYNRGQVNQEFCRLPPVVEKRV